MSLDDFKAIFYWEWGHRLLGRFIGLAFIVPLVIFSIRGMIGSALRLPLAGLFILGGAQGAMGWFMVQSGLVDEPSVSQYRLTVHLMLALILFTAIFWFALKLWYMSTVNYTYRIPVLIRVLAVCVALQLILGGLVAGLKAGYIMQDWPFMAGEVIPHSLFAITPVWDNFGENAVTVQFFHRFLAYCIAGLTLFSAVKYWHHAYANVGLSVRLMLGVVFVQLIAGIFTLLLGMPIWLAVLHQGGGVLVLASLVFHIFHQRYGPAIN